MARPARIDLRTFQQELAARLATKTAAQVESSRLGLLCAGTRWLVRLADRESMLMLPRRRIQKMPKAGQLTAWWCRSPKRLRRAQTNA